MPQYYQLSPHYRLLTNKSDTNEEEYFLYHPKNDETFLVNIVIHTFLSFFEKKPISFLESVAQFADAFEGKAEDVLVTVNRFFGDMFHQDILMRIEDVEHILSFPLKKESVEKEILFPSNVLSILSQEDHLSIFLIENKVTKLKSVLKILHLDAFLNSDTKKQYKKSFIQEKNILQEIKEYPDIGNITQFADNQHFMFIELEYFEGIGLRQFILSKPLSTEQKIKLYQNVLDAYAFLHQKDVLHGDIHASNILVKENLSIKVIDFDMSYHNSPKKIEIISTGGVQSYIAPEKISKNAFKVAKKRADFRSEVYQLGIIGYIIFMEKLPFEDNTWKLLAKKIKDEKPFFNKDKINTSCMVFLEKALDKKPKERFSSAIEMASIWQNL